jgi:hypothetical protein
MDVRSLIRCSLNLVPRLFRVHSSICIDSNQLQAKARTEFGNTTITLINRCINPYFGPISPKEMTLLFDVQHERNIMNNFSLSINYVNYKNIIYPIGFNQFEEIRSNIESSTRANTSQFPDDIQLALDYDDRFIYTASLLRKKEDMGNLRK